MPRREPVWLSRAHVEAIHTLQWQQYGGLAGLRDAGALESALGRAQHKWHYHDADIIACAAAYAFAIAANHAFADGSKRTALVSMATFLELNRVRFTATEADAVITIVALAAGTLSETRMCEWLRDNTKPQRQR